MDKILDKLLVEFLIPAILMMVSMALLVDIEMGDAFNLNDKIYNLKLTDSIAIIILIVFSYIINISLSSLLHAILRIWVWGKTREYLIYRKLNIFKEKGVIKAMYRPNIFIFIILSLIRYKKLETAINNAKEGGDCNLYQHLLTKLQQHDVHIKCYKTIFDMYDTIRTLVLESSESAIIGWIQYHWAQLRLARGTLIPFILIAIFLPVAMEQWGMDEVIVQKTCYFFIGVVLIQAFHYYYREKYMIYAMLSYFISLPDVPPEDHPHGTG